MEDKKMTKAIQKARQAAKEEFIDWLKDKDKKSEHATKRQGLMMQCTHPENHRVYPDHSKENSYNDDMVWLCTACGYAEFKEEEKSALEKIKETQELIHDLNEQSSDAYDQHVLSQAWRKLDDVLQALDEDY